MTVRELMDRMDAQEVAEWSLFDQIRATEADAAAKHAEMTRKRGR